MSGKQIRILAVAALACAAVVAHAAPTVEEAANKELELRQLKAEAEIEDVRAKKAGATQAPGQPHGPVPAAVATSRADEDEDLRLAGVYGLGNELRADILYRGAVITLSKANPQMGPWKLVAIEPNAIKLARGKQVRTILVSSTVGQQAGGMTTPGAVPYGPGSLPALPAAQYR